MPTSAQLTVLIPARDHADVIAQSVRSVQAQSERDFAAIVLCDGAGADTIAHAKAACENDARFRIEAHAASGAPATLNRLAGMADTPFVALLAAGDVWDADHLARGVQALQAHPQALASFCGYLEQGSEPAPSNKDDAPSVLGAAAMTALTLQNSLAASTAVLRQEALGRVTPFARAFERMHAWDLWLRISLQGEMVMRPDVGAYLMPAAIAEAAVGTPARAQAVAVAHEQLRVLEEMAPRMIAHHRLPMSTWALVHGQMALHAITIGDAARALTHLATKAKHDMLLEHEQLWMLQCLIATNRLGAARDLADVLFASRQELSEAAQQQLMEIASSAGWSLGPAQGAVAVGRTAHLGAHVAGASAGAAHARPSLQ